VRQSNVKLILQSVHGLKLALKAEWKSFFTML